MTPKPIAYVQAAWHTDITDHCRSAFMAEMVFRYAGAEIFRCAGERRGA